MTFPPLADLLHVDGCRTEAHVAGSLPLHATRPHELAQLLLELPVAQAQFLEQCGFTAAAGEVSLLPGAMGVAGAVLGLGSEPALHSFGALPYRLPSDSLWRLHDHVTNAADAALGFCLGAYAFELFKPHGRRSARLVMPDGAEQAAATAAVCWMVRDLINMPPNVLGPAELAEVVAALAVRHGAIATIVQGAELATAYPAVAAVGRGSAREPRVARFTWAGSGAAADAPLIALCGKGVCFDSGGYDIKPAAGMLRMKKDMGGAAVMLGVARLIMEADLPVRLAVRIGCVENSVSGEAMRPLDVLRTRNGITVEVGNTDAEGRLVLCELLAEACEDKPALLIDCATLTGAARVALGPDLPALFCNDDALAGLFQQQGIAHHDPIWRLPLWSGYDFWLNSEGRAHQQRCGEAYGRGYRGGTVSAAIRDARHHMGAFRRLRLERYHPARTPGGRRIPGDALHLCDPARKIFDRGWNCHV